MKDVDYRGSGEGAHDQPRPVGGAIFTRPITRTSRRRAWVVAICSALIGCIVSIARLWKYQLVLTSARDRSIGCLRSISSERHPVYDRLGGVAFRAANPPEGSMREHRRLSWRSARYDLVAEAGRALLWSDYRQLR